MISINFNFRFLSYFNIFILMLIQTLHRNVTSLFCHTLIFCYVVFGPHCSLWSRGISTINFNYFLFPFWDSRWLCLTSLLSFFWIRLGSCYNFYMGRVRKPFLTFCNTHSMVSFSWAWLFIWLRFNCVKILLRFKSLTFSSFFTLICYLLYPFLRYHWFFNLLNFSCIKLSLTLS